MSNKGGTPLNKVSYFLISKKALKQQTPQLFKDILHMFQNPDLNSFYYTEWDNPLSDILYDFDPDFDHFQVI